MKVQVAKTYDEEVDQMISQLLGFAEHTPFQTQAEFLVNVAKKLFEIQTDLSSYEADHYNSQINGD